MKTMMAAIANMSTISTVDNKGSIRVLSVRGSLEVGTILHANSSDPSLYSEVPLRLKQEGFRYPLNMIIS